jgi:hypothetical protein
MGDQASTGLKSGGGGQRQHPDVPSAAVKAPASSICFQEECM